jgi:hypothetical protein
MSPSYGALAAEMLKALPELCPAESEADFAQVTPYEAIDEYLNPLIEGAILCGDEGLLVRIFAFVESMAASDDKEITNLVWVGVSEHLGGASEKLLLASRPYMGPHTRDISDHVELTMHGRDVVLSAAGRELVQHKELELRRILAEGTVADETRRATERMLANILRALER